MDVPFFSAGDRPMVPSKTMAATMAAVKQQQMLIQQQKQRNAGQNGNGKSSDLPDFFTSKNDMGKCFLCKHQIGKHHFSNFSCRFLNPKNFFPI